MLLRKLLKVIRSLTKIKQYEQYSLLVDSDDEHEQQEITALKDVKAEPGIFNPKYKIVNPFI
jgi:hypothetical protein